MIIWAVKQSAISVNKEIMLAEKIFNFSDPSEARHLIGMHDELLQTMRQEFPSLALSSRGQDLFIKGPEEEANILESMLLHLRALDRHNRCAILRNWCATEKAIS